VAPLANALVRDRAFAPNWRNQEADDLPATCVSASDAQRIAEWLGMIDGRAYALPTEAQWEYMARAGSVHPFWWPPDKNGLGMAIFGVTSPQPSDCFRANPWGLIDVLGNVAEWTASEYRPLQEAAYLRTVPGISAGSRTVRGGSYRDRSIAAVRVSCRRSARVGSRMDDVGLRLICPVV
jgi:formylglycine-generating enzyme required for sulfatase activity